MSAFDRRTFIQRGMLAAGATVMQGLVARAAVAESGYQRLLARDRREGLGPLSPRKSENTGDIFLALPAGFRYTVFGRAGDIMSDGSPTPGLHDGMGTFTVGGQIRLVRNHEISNIAAQRGLAFGPEVMMYDPTAGAGTTSLLIDPKSRLPVHSGVSLGGTLQNCSGGRTPWGTWITCEENTLGTESGTSQGHAFGGFDKPHGYCFEVPANPKTQMPPVPLREMGRFVHEAVAVDPATGIIYLTEDRLTAGFYRFLPRKKALLTEGGRLQMLAVKGSPGLQTSTGQKVGARLETTWVEIDDPDPAGAAVDELLVYKQGVAKGGATFARLEGCCHGNGRIYFTATSGGPGRHGQVWEYRPLGADSGALTLIFESPSASVLDMPDNITVSPRGGLVICEDGDGENFVRGLGTNGALFDLAKNIAPGYETSEFAGATFSPDGQTLFVNIQSPGMTLAIWGPWRKGLI